MKKRFLIILSLLTLSITGCSNGISEEEYTTLQTEKEQLETQKTDLETSLASAEKKNSQLSDELETKTSEYDNLNSDYKEYKTKMVPYEKLSVAEAEAKTAEEEKKKEEAEKAKKEQEEAEQAEKEAAKQAEADQKAAEEAAGYETGITYDQLARTPDDYTGKKVKFSGKVVQVMEDDSSIQIRLAVNDDYDCVLLGAYDPDIVSSRVLDDDNITIYGSSLGLISYDSTMGGKITIPSVLIEKIEQ